ncbi:aromatic acid exporter family protein [Clostridium sp.]|uniref:aromatic acid exporter family protein n=1 Tax=Clostridium sp. TaxID=1506 RepID=UPI00261E9DA6|nr:aromatic acid exporter family protein [Clostridium sp.]
MKYLDNIAFKMSVSAVVALALATVLDVEFSAVAGVIAILSIQDTRRKSLMYGKSRVLACFLAIFLSVIIYKGIGQSSVTFGIFLIIFIPLTSKLKIPEGMVPAVVLSTHLLIADNINQYWIINEVLLTIIGVGVAAIANIYMPSLDRNFQEDKEYIENKYKLILTKMSKSLITHTVDLDEEKILINLEIRLKESQNRAYKILNNQLLKGDTYYVDYINMRINQFDIIKKLRSHFEKFYMSFEQTHMISMFTKNVADQIKETNNCEDLLKSLEVLKSDFKKMSLPKTREEFENRAQLLQFLNDMEDLLNIKRKFVLGYKNNIDR